jgi:phosphotransferase system  glucose/maltose/N-acetylglucosamine-specific IIC component
MADDPLIQGRNENAPVRSFNRVALVVLIAVLIAGGIIYGLFAAFHGKQSGPTMPAITSV